jgi:glycosyltransferase involved in cell wall biosynthesis
VRAWQDDPAVEAWLVPVNPMPPRPLRPLLRLKYARTIVTELTYIPLLAKELARADVVHVFSASYASFLLAPLPAIAMARALGRPVVLNYRSGQAPDHLRRSALARRALMQVDSNIVESDFLVGVFREFGIAAGAIPNVVDLNEFAFRLRNPVRPRLLSTRNFDALYNVACTIRAFRLVQDRRPDATLTLVGGGPQEGRLRRLAADLNVQNVRFAGRVPPDQIAQYYREHDIYIQSPDIDNMPLSVIEAYASGLPVVSTDAGGVPAILTDGEHGLLAPRNDHATLAAQVLRLLDGQVHAQHLTRAAYARCQAWTWPSVRNQWLAAYRAVLSRRAERAFQASRDRSGRPVRGIPDRARGSAPTEPS